MATKVQVDVEIKDNSKSLKSQLREAQAEVAQLAEKYGATSKEAANAAKRAAELKDAIGDAKSLTDAFNPDAKFNSLSSSIGGVLNGFQAFEGALGLVAVEGEAVQQTLLKVQSAMALSQGLQGIGEAKDSFVQLGSVVKNSFNGMTTAGKAFAVTGIGLILTGIATAIAYADDLKEMFGGALTAQEALTATNEDYKKSVTDTSKKVTEVGVAFDLAKKGVISKEEALKTYNETLGDSLGKANNYNEAEALFVSKSDAYIKATALRAQATALLGKAAEEQAKGLTAQLEDQTSFGDKLSAVSLFGELNVKKLYKAQADGVKEQKKRFAERAKIFEDEAKKLLEQAENIDKASGIESKAEDKKTESLKSNSDTRKQDLESLRKFEEELREKQLSEQEKEVLSVQKKYEEQLKIAKKYKQDLKLLEENQANEIQAIRNRYQVQDEEQALSFLKEREQKSKEQNEIDNQKRLDQAGAELLANAEKNRKLAEQDLQAKEKARQIQDAKTNITLQGLQLVSEIADLFAKKDEESARKAFQIQKAVSLAETTIKTIQAVQNAFTSASASPITVGFPAYPFIQAGLAGGFGAVQLAKIASTQFNGGGSGIGSSSGGGATGANTSTPQFNIVGQANTNPLQQFDGVLKAYVVGSDVTSQQQLDRERINAATFG